MGTLVQLENPLVNAAASAKLVRAELSGARILADLSSASLIGASLAGVDLAPVPYAVPSQFGGTPPTLCRRAAKGFGKSGQSR
jgi:hypothetical protein